MSSDVMDSKNKMKICICCMCGIPGSGKSTICQQLKFQLQGNFLVFMINFDKILLDSSSKTAQLWKSLDSRQSEDAEKIMKGARAQVLNAVEFFMQQMKTVNMEGLMSMSELTKPKYISEDVWLRVLALFLDSLHACHLDSTHQVLFLIDDNMYLRSMRYEYYKKAKMYRTGFCQIFVKSPLQTAKERDKCRHGRDHVGDDVIEKMYQKLEAPDPSRHTWERFNSVLNTDIDSEVDLEQVARMIKGAFANPAHPSPQVDEEERLYSQNVCSASLIHQVDLILRKCISKSMMKAKGHQADLKQLSKNLLSVKDDILCLMKKGEICIPEPLDLCDVVDASKDENTELFKYIENLFAYSSNLKLK